MSVSVLQTSAVTGSNDRLERFQAIYDEQNAYVRRTLFWLVPREAVDDLVQEVFLKIWKKLDSFREESSARTWIYRITANTAYDFLRSRRGDHRQVDLDAHPELEAPTEEGADPALQKLIREGIETLPVKQRMVFVLFYKQELTVEEIASSLRLPKGTVKSRLFHARATFSGFLSQHGVTL